MRILYLLTQDLISPSGLGRYWPLACALAGRGHDVHIAALHSSWAKLEERHFLREGVWVDYVAPMHVIKTGNQKKYYPTVRLFGVVGRATWSLSRSAITLPVDIIHVCKPHPMNGIAGLLAARLKRSILCVDCDDFEAGSNRFTGGWQQTIVAFFEKRIPFNARLITTNTMEMKSKLISWGCSAEHIFYLSNGIDLQRFSPPDPTKIDSLRTQLGLDGKRAVLFLGTMSLPSHPVDLLLQSFVKVLQEYPEAALLLVGGGEDIQKLIDQSRALGVNEATRFTGRVLPSDVPLYYALADVSVDPVHDNEVGRARSPLKLFESWACGVPFVTAPVGDRPFLLSDPPAGLIAKHAGDPNTLAESIMQILGSKNLAQELRSEGLKRVKQYTWERLAVHLEQVYQEL